MDINRQPEQVAVDQPTKPIEYVWLKQREAVEGNAVSVWKFGFIAPDGAEVRVTFHEVGDVEGHQQDVQAKKDQAAQSSMMMGMPPMPDQSTFTPSGQPNTDQTTDAQFYVTFFSNRHPEFFMKWDTSLPHEQSLVVWVTITHGLIDFVQKAKPSVLILDDLANGKLKMVLRSVAQDIVAANPEYEIEQTQKHHYRTFFQIKKTGMGSAFGDTVQGRSIEGQTDLPQSNSPVMNGRNQESLPAQAQQSQSAQLPDQETADTASTKMDKVDDDKSQDPTMRQPEDEKAFPSQEEIPIKQTPKTLKGLTVEIGKDYSVAVKDVNGDAIDRYRGKGPADLLRWINAKGYAANKMVIVDTEQPSKSATPKKRKQVDVPETVGAKPDSEHNKQFEGYEIDGTSVKMPMITPQRAAAMNTIVCAETVRCEADRVIFQFATDKDMDFKKALVEIAFKRTEKG